MKIRYVVALCMGSAMALPTVTLAQGLVGGTEEGVHRGNRAAGPLGAVVGGAVGAGVGTVNGALGIRPGFYHGRRCHYRYARHHRTCRY
jgi:hypothetical protein